MENHEEILPFAKAEVVRLMKQLNEYPYASVEYYMFKESSYPYKNIKRINQEKERILLHLESIKSDCNALEMDVEKTLKLNQ